MSLPIRPVLIDKNGVFQVFHALPVPPFGSNVIRIEPAKYVATDLEADEASGDARMRVYVQDDTASFPSVDRDHLRREISGHGDLLDLFDRFDAGSFHPAKTEKPIFVDRT